MEGVHETRFKYFFTATPLRLLHEARSKEDLCLLSHEPPFETRCLVKYQIHKLRLFDASKGLRSRDIPLLPAAWAHDIVSTIKIAALSEQRPCMWARALVHARQGEGMR